MTEYVKFSGPESVYGQKYLLHSELDLIGIVKKIKNYKKLRQEELVLRVALKEKIDSFLESLKMLDKLLPHDKLPGLSKKRHAHDVPGVTQDRESLSLEQELEIIRRRLERLGED